MDEKALTIVLAAYFPLEEKLRQTIKANMDSTQEDIDVGQATHNQTKTLTSIPKSWAFQTRFQLVAVPCSLNAELLIASNAYTFLDEPGIDSANKPTLCIYNK